MGLNYDILCAYTTKQQGVCIYLSCFRLGKSLDQVTSTDREQTKRVVYSVMYGVGR